VHKLMGKIINLKGINYRDILIIVDLMSLGVVSQLSAISRTSEANS
jgi:hypothetical protein